MIIETDNKEILKHYEQYLEIKYHLQQINEMKTKDNDKEEYIIYKMNGKEDGKFKTKEDLDKAEKLYISLKKNIKELMILIHQNK